MNTKSELLFMVPWWRWIHWGLNVCRGHEIEILISCFYFSFIVFDLYKTKAENDAKNIDSNSCNWHGWSEVLNFFIFSCLLTNLVLMWKRREQEYHSSALWEGMGATGTLSVHRLWGSCLSHSQRKGTTEEVAQHITKSGSLHILCSDSKVTWNE